MTLRLTLSGYLADRSAERVAEEEAGTEEVDPRDGGHGDEPADSDPSIAALALAMGTVADRTSEQRTALELSAADFAAAELEVIELAVAMGGLVERPSAPHAAAEPAAAAEQQVDDRLAAPDTAAEETEAEVGEPAPGDIEDVHEATPEDAPEAPGETASAPEWDGAQEAGAAPRTPAAEDLEQAVVAVLGLDHAGLPAAIALRSGGARVIGVERSATRLASIRSGASQLSRPEQELLREHLSGRGFVLTEDTETLAAAEYVLICVPAPVDRERRPNGEPLRQACEAVVRHARPGQTIVLTSTTYVGSTRELLVEPLEREGLRVGEDVFVAFSPERADPGVDGHGQRETPRVVGAVSERCHERASRLLAHVSRGLHRVSSPEAAEMAKLYENAFRAVNIALAFEIADACRPHELDPLEVTGAAATKPFGFLAHHPSAGVGGACIGVDPHHLAEPLRGGGRPATLTEEALRKIAARPRQVVWRAQELLIRAGRQLHDARVLVVGAAYKPGVADSRHSPGVEIVTRLQAEGADVDYHDPLIPELLVGDEALCGVDPDPRRDASRFGPEDYDLAIVVVVHPGHDYGWLRRIPEVLDCTYSCEGGRRRFLP